MKAGMGKLFMLAVLPMFLLEKLHPPGREFKSVREYTSEYLFDLDESMIYEMGVAFSLIHMMIFFNG